MPTTTSSSRSRVGSPAGLAALVLGLALGLSGCTEGPKPEQCGDFEEPTLLSPPDSATLRARVVIETATSVDETGMSAVSNTIRVSLTDVSKVLQSSRKQSTLGIGTPGCYALTGLPVTDQCREGFQPPCTVEYLGAEAIEIVGLAGGSMITLDEQDRLAQGSYRRDLKDGPLLGPGSLVVRIVGSLPGDFPSLEAQLPQQPALLQLREPLVSGKPLGPGDLKIRWEPGSADRMVLNANELSGKTQDDLQCLLVDDGCQTLLAGDLEFLEMTVGTKLKLQMIRESSQVVTNSDKTQSLEVKVVSRVEMVLQR